MSLNPLPPPMDSRKPGRASALNLPAAVVLLLMAPVAPVLAATTELLIAPTGEAAADQFGVSVASVGDLNGDGFDDVIVGAFLNDAGGSNAGRAYVYYGGPSADATADLTLTGEVVGDWFGYSVGSAGDVNGDGFDDVIVGAYLNDAGGSSAGRAYIYYGGPFANTVADLTLTGEASGDRLGISVGSAGDVNGDGFDDVIVGAHQNDAGGTDAGRAYVYYGGPSADSTADLTFTGEAAGDNFGRSVRGAGDVNGDGFDDVIVGAYVNDGGGLDAGRAYIYYGGSSADTTADLTLTGEAAGDRFGFSVDSAGDVNGDGFCDVIVGALYNDAGGPNAGRAYVYHGGPSADATADLTLTGEVVGDWFGYSVGSAGDVNGDGFDDVIVGAHLNDAGGTDAGRAYVYHGGQYLDVTADLTLTGEAPGDHFGAFVGSAGDFDGDGLDDVIVGADFNDAGGMDAGRAYIYSTYPYRVTSPNGGEQWVAARSATVRWKGHEPADLELSVDGGLTYSVVASGVGGNAENKHTIVVPTTPTAGAVVRVKYQGQFATRSNSDASDAAFRIVEPVVPAPVACRLDLTFTGEAASDEFGSVGSAGDVNGDGFDDVIVGARRNDAGGTDAGRAYVYYGGPSADATADLTLTGEAADDEFGFSVGSAGDVNGDGFGDVIVGARHNDAGGPAAGRAYVYYGGAAADSAADLTLTGEASVDEFGYSVGSAGDVNGDGFDDVIVGARYNDAGGPNAGRAYVYHGGPSADATADLTLTGEAVFDYFGVSVGSAGDVNGDGFDDLIVGADLNDAGATNAGRAYVYHGGPSADATADLTLTGEAAFDNFGWSVGSAGDVNGDGFDDVIVGARYNDAGGPNAGRAYVYHGGPSADATADLTLTGEAADDNFGWSAGSAGDANGDGFDDVIVGALYNDAGGPNAGRAYVYHGGPSADATADLALTGEAAFDNFGYSVGSAGDVNGDGFDDVIVGANLSDAGGSDAGRAYVYDCNRYFVTSPVGGGTWNVGATEVVDWMGAEPADVFLSADGGGTFVSLATSVGGGESNSLPIVVPHLPTRFARVKVSPSNAAVHGSDRSDSLFTIDASITLLSFQAAFGEGSSPQAIIRWQTDPEPEDLAAYRLERSDAGSSWRMLAETLETEHVDAEAAGGSRYRLTAINRLGTEYVLGETTLGLISPLAAWPLPYRGGELRIAFGTLGGLGGGASRAEVSVFDLAGRRVRTVTSGEFPAGYHQVAWDGRDARGRAVSSGIYFLRVNTPGNLRTQKVTVVR